MWGAVVGGEVMVGPCEHSPPPTTTRHMSELWQRVVALALLFSLRSWEDLDLPKVNYWAVQSINIEKS